MSACAWHDQECNFEPITRPINPNDRVFRESEFDEEQIEQLREEILMIPGTALRSFLPDAILFHSTSSTNEWWKAKLPESQSAGGIFFSTNPEISMLGGKAPFGVTLQYQVHPNDVGVLYLPSRNSMGPILQSLSSDNGDYLASHLVGDDIIPLLNQLGFLGYYSCDECELYLINEIIPLVIYPKPEIYSDRRMSRSYTIRRG